MENQEKLIVTVEGPLAGRTSLLAGILQLLRGVGISGALETKSRNAVVTASADTVQVHEDMGRLGDRFVIELRGQDPQRATIPVGSSPDGVASAAKDEK